MPESTENIQARAAIDALYDVISLLSSHGEYGYGTKENQVAIKDIERAITTLKNRQPPELRS